MSAFATFDRLVQSETPVSLEDLFDLGYHFKNVDRIFARVFGEDVHAKALAAE